MRNFDSHRAAQLAEDLALTICALGVAALVAFAVFGGQTDPSRTEQQAAHNRASESWQNATNANNAPHHNNVTNEVNR